MHVTVHAAYQQTLSAHLATWQKRRSRALSQELLDATLILLRLDLDPLTPLLMTLYSTAPRGRPPYDPLAMFRALLLLTLLRYQSIEPFAVALRQQPRLAIIAGFQPFETPAVGTFYLFIDRLEDGPFQPACPHRVQPSARRHGKHVRNLSKEKAEKEAARKQILAQCDSLTAHLTQQMLTTASQPRPDDSRSAWKTCSCRRLLCPPPGVAYSALSIGCWCAAMAPPSPPAPAPMANLPVPAARRASIAASVTASIVIRPLIGATTRIMNASTSATPTTSIASPAAATICLCTSRSAPPPKPTSRSRLRVWIGLQKPARRTTSP